LRCSWTRPEDRKRTVARIAGLDVAARNRDTMHGSKSFDLKSLAYALVCIAVLPASPALADQPDYVDFFKADNAAYEAYLDLNNQSVDGKGHRLVNVKIAAISDAFRGWIKANFPGGETAAYAIDPYEVDCADKTVGEHRVVFFDANGFPLTNYDFGGAMSPPVGGSMQDAMMKKVCGF
jgi:hypothetical protein